MGRVMDYSLDRGTRKCVSLHVAVANALSGNVALLIER
jgi:hypothetical protein